MPQHVGMDWKRHFGGRPKSRHHPSKGNCGHGSASLAHEEIPSGFLLALETAQGAKFDAGQGVDGTDPILQSIDVQAAMDEIGLIPAQRTQFGCSQSARKASKTMVTSRRPCQLFPAPFTCNVGQILPTSREVLPRHGMGQIFLSLWYTA